MELAVALRIEDRPAGERPRDVDHVGLRVTAVHAEGVQLQQLAAVVLVEPLIRPRRGEHDAAAEAGPFSGSIAT